MGTILPAKTLMRAWGIMSIMILISLVSCAGPQSYTLHLRIEPERTYDQPPGITFGVMPFEDSRPHPQSLGKRVRWDGKEEPFTLDSTSPSDELTEIMRRYLRAKGFRVVDLTSWKPEPDALDTLPKGVQVAVAGRIDDLEIEAHSSLWKTSLQCKVRLSAKVGLKEKNEVLTRSVEIIPKETYVRFDLRRIERRLNLALAEALDNLLQGLPPSSARNP